MPNEPLTLTDILAGLPDGADYETVHAAVMASERGRRFLAEYAGRNRHADTQMLVAAIGQVEAAIRGEPSPQASATAHDLIEIAVAIDRVAAAIAADKVPDISAAIERIQDIAFVLHERPVEATLCDTLDTAIAEVSGAVARGDSAGGVRRATDLLQSLAARVREMIGPSAPQQIAAVPERAMTSGEAAPATKNAGVVLFEGAIDFVMPQSKAPAADDIDNVTVPQGESVDATSPMPDVGSNDVSATADILSHMLAAEHFSTDVSEEPVAEAVVPSDTAEIPAPVTEAEQTRQSQFAATPVSGTPIPPADDPLAAVRALSEEELIALFS